MKGPSSGNKCELKHTCNFLCNVELIVLLELEVEIWLIKRFEKLKGVKNSPFEGLRKLSSINTL